MKHIKKFEAFDFSQTIPVTTKNFLTNYYSCDECNALWREYNKQSDRCKFCTSEEIEELPEDEWYEVIKTRLEPDEIEDLESSRKKSESEMVDLLNNTDDLLESIKNDYTILPQSALDELEMYVDYKDPNNKIEVVPDPKVDGTFAVRVYRKKDNSTFDLLWYKGGYDEVDFETWPPVSSDLKFFL